MSNPDYISKANVLKNHDNFVIIRCYDERETVMSDALSIVLQGQKDYVLIVLWNDTKNDFAYASIISPDKLAKMELRDYLLSGVTGLSEKVVVKIINERKICAIDLGDCDRDSSVEEFYEVFNIAAVALDSGAKSLMFNKAFVLYSSDGSPLLYPLPTSPPVPKNADIFITGKDLYDDSRHDNSKDPVFKANYKRSKDKLSKALEDCIVQDIQLQSDVAYEGFSLKKMRHNFFEKTAGVYSASEDFMSFRALIDCFTAYAAIGNNIGKLKNKRTDTTASQALMIAVSGYKVESKASSKNSLTLPRIAIAFMPQYFLFRKFILKEAQNQTSSVINVMYKDQAFAGCDQINTMGGYKEYYEEFSQMISKENVGKSMDKKQKLNEDSVKERNDKWMSIAKAGYNSDRDIHDMMNTALTAVNTDKDAYNHIMIGIEKLRIASKPATRV